MASELFHVLKRTEGGIGQKQAIANLNDAGIKARPCRSIYVGHAGVEVTGTNRQIEKADRILRGS